ncbi:phosphoglucomutase/phosphomannomutase PgmG [Sphingomonas sp.]|uniref:phosphoglucomutase/phosphomannomutase PgmG n=1 Tax=Sphingomonas sp. TaxID=28214 RepID=UPI002ED953C2
MSTPSHINPGALREYDVRGIVGTTLDARDAYAIGRGFATCIRRGGGTRVAVGRDGRLTSPMLEAAVIEGLTASGVDVVRIGLGPTPMLYHAERLLEVDGGLQVTGSHNPAEYNGFKLVQAHRSFFGAAIQGLATMAAAADWSEGAGTVTDADMLDAYVGRLLSGYAGGTFRIAWDCGNGAAGPAIARLVAQLPGEHHLLFAEVDGTFPHHHPDPSIEANLADLKRVVAERKLEFGVAFDGDGDRIGAIDGAGRVIWGDQLLSILAEPVLGAHPGATIVGDVKASRTLFDRIAALGGRPVMWKSGHSLMKEKMVETGAMLGGEMSGHIFFGEAQGGFDDAPYAAVQLIRAIHLSGGSLAQLRDALPSLVASPEIRLPVDEARKFGIVAGVLARLEAQGAAIDRTDGARVTTADGWWLLRASNTEPALTLRAEAPDQAGLDRLLAAIETQLNAEGVSLLSPVDPR